ncbi:MAG: sodium/sugar symporter [Deltaproteobacteria bacterium]|nr:sodium/sugar symporter [Deltaproteobacteria bacterium]
MNHHFEFPDYVVFFFYAFIILSVGLWVSRNKKGHSKTSEDYFLASKSLTWWAVGASLIAANISAEQFIGMSGSGFAIGLGIATYEWIGALGLIIVGKFFLPVFIEKKIYTMPQFLQQRYDNRVRTILAVFWVLVFVFVNLTSVLYLGALAIKTIMGVPLMYGILGLALFAAAYSLYGGLSAVAWTDVIQVVFLIGGGLFTTWLALDFVSNGHGVISGAEKIYHSAPEKFHMILHKDNPYFKDLPGISMLIGGIWVANLYYWGFNQYIIQRALASKSIEEAQKGVIFAGFLKILIPLLVVIPGITAFVLVNDPVAMAKFSDVSKAYMPTLQHADKAYPWLMGLLPTGIKGLAFAALVAAIVSSLASMLNSTSTIFTMDIYRQFINKNATETRTVNIGRITAFAALIIAGLIAPVLQSLDQVFQYIQEYTGMVSPGILVIFLFGLFWPKTTTNAAIWVAVLTLPVALIFKFGFSSIPFINQMGLCFLFLSGIIIVISLLDKKHPAGKGLELSGNIFHTSMSFNIGSVLITTILAVLYILFW